MKKLSGLRRRWLLNTVGVVCTLGLLCVLIITTVSAATYYSNMESDLRYRAKTITEYFAEHLNQNYNDYYQSCITYAQTFEDREDLELQFINAQQQIVASSYGRWAGQSPTTPEIGEAIATRSIRPFVGKDPFTGQHIMAVSSPMIYSNGEVIGVLRFVTSTQVMDRQIAIVAGISLGALGVFILLVILSSNYYIRTILAPLNAIIKKAKRITSGSYGMQIQTKYDDEIGELAQTINEMSAQISQNEKIQRDFISSLSHELRTPPVPAGVKPCWPVIPLILKRNVA